MLGISYVRHDDKGNKIKVGLLQQIKDGIHYQLNEHGYYKIEDLQDWGHCGLCGELIKEMLPRNWAWGLCDKCKTE